MFTCQFGHLSTTHTATRNYASRELQSTQCGICIRTASGCLNPYARGGLRTLDLRMSQVGGDPRGTPECAAFVEDPMSAALCPAKPPGRTMR